MILPSTYSNGFAPRDGQPLYPELWRDCVGAWAPCLGPTGLTLRDWSGFGNHGTLTGMVAGDDWVPSQGRYALDFDGTDDFVNAGVRGANQLFNTNELSVTAWVNATVFSGSTFRGIVSASQTGPFPFSVRYRTDFNELQLLTDGAVLQGGSFGLGSWVHVAAVLFPGSRTLYLNGAVSAQSSASWTITQNGNSLYFGLDFTSGRNWSGFIDDVRIYRRAVTSSEIRLLASRRGIAYDLAPRRRSRIFTGGFRAYWAARKAQIIGGGL